MFTFKTLDATKAKKWSNSCNLQLNAMFMQNNSFRVVVTT